MNKLFEFKSRILLTLILLGMVLATFIAYVFAEKQVDAANEQRQTSILLADELRQSSDDLTRMVRTYVATSNPAYKRHYHEILDIRNGKKPRPAGYHNIYWDLIDLDDVSTDPATKPVPLLTLMRQAGFTELEFAKLAEAKANSDELTKIEFSAMSLLDGTQPPTAQNRAYAINMLHDALYHEAKARIMRPINEVFALSDQRTLATVDAAEETAFLLRVTFVLFAALLAWQLFAIRRREALILGGPIEQVHAQLATLRGSDTSQFESSTTGARKSILEEIARTQSRLAELDRIRKESESALAESEARFRTLLESSPNIAVQGYDEARRVIFWNHASELLYGYSKKEALGHQLEDLIIPEAMRQDVINAHSDWLAGGPAIPAAELVLHNKNGTPVPVFSSHAMQQGLNGLEMYCIDIDLTEQKRSEHRLDLALSATKIIIWEIDFTTGKLGYDKSAMRNLNLGDSSPPDTLEGWIARVHPEDREHFTAMVMQALQPVDTQGFNHEYRFIDHAQNYHWLQTVGRVAQRDLTGQALLGVGYTVNIDERKHNAAIFDRQVRYNEIMRRVSVSLINLPLTQLDDAINTTLAEIGAFFDVDRVYIFKYDLINGTSSNTYEWCASGIYPQIETLQELPISAMPEWFETHRSGEALLIPSVQSLPPGPVRDILEPQGIHSLLSAPIMAKSECMGFIGLDAVRHEVMFGDEERKLLALFAELLANIHQRKRTEDALHEAFELKELLVKHVPGTLYQFRLRADGTTHFPYASKGITDIYGVSPEQIVNDATPVFKQIHPEDLIRISESIQTSARTLDVWHEEYRVIKPNGETIWLEGESSPEAKPDGSLVWHGYIRDITDRKHTEERLRLSANVFSHAREGIIITDKDANIVDVNSAFTTITGYSRDEVLGKNPRLLNSGQQDKAFYAAMWQDLLNKFHWSGEIWNRRKDGGLFSEMLTISAVPDNHGEIMNFIALFSDITAVKEYQTQLERIAHYDTLTGLPNRLLLGDRLRLAMSQASRRGQKLVVAYVDLDGFKAVNDTHGHEMGDQLLATLAMQMTQVMRDGDTLARIGGDEFVAVLVDLPDIETSLPTLTRLLNVASQPMPVGDIMLHVSASLGVTLFPQSEDVDADQLLRQADQAMYQAKQNGKNRYQIFDAEHARSIRTHYESLEHIRNALNHQEFVLYYQPKINMRKGELVGVEALIRWQHPQQGLVSPAAFLPVIENHPLSIELGEWVLDTALTQIESWHASGLSIPVSVNVSALQLQQADFVPRLRALLARHPAINPDELELEILETSALEDIAVISQVMSACQELGVNFALDDFGTGYSSLLYLKQLPANLLKIDQSFVRDMLDDPDDFAILEGVLGLATAFRRKAIAEGVETITHGEMLIRMGCEWAQGYAIARPMPADALAHWINTWEAPSSWKVLEPISRDRLPALSASVEHRAWVNAMTNYLLDKRDTPPERDAHQCRFGQWLDHHGRELLFGVVMNQPVDAIHLQIHRLGDELIALKQGGHADVAKSRIHELHQLRDQLLEQLTALY